ncbi:MAG: hypothetical protein U0U69_12625 [Acidimicrobiia bacterium]
MKTKSRRFSALYVVLVAAVLSSAACTRAVSETEPESTTTSAAAWTASAVASLPQPATDFCKAAQASLGAMALGDLPKTVVDARAFYEDSWTSVARASETAQVRESAESVLNIRSTAELTSEVRVQVATEMLTVYRAVSDECPDLAEPVRIFLTRILVTAETKLEIVTEIWRSILEVSPLPELAPAPSASTDSTTSTTTTLGPPTGPTWTEAGYTISQADPSLSGLAVSPGQYCANAIRVDKGSQLVGIGVQDTCGDPPADLDMALRAKGAVLTPGNKTAANIHTTDAFVYTGTNVGVIVATPAADQIWTGPDKDALVTMLETTCYLEGITASLHSHTSCGD